MSNYLEEHGYRAYLEAAVGTLEPCPLCGGDVTYSSGVHIGYDMDTGTLRCDDCGLSLRARLYGFGMYDPLHAFDSWNTRAERTCEIARVETGEPAEYDCDEVLWHCESCHEEVAIYAYNENGDTWADKPAFCPNCGAKVVK